MKVGICIDSQDTILSGLSPYLSMIVSLLVTVGLQSSIIGIVFVGELGKLGKTNLETKWSLNFCTIPT